MSVFDSVGKKVKDAGQKTVQKTKEITEIGKLNTQISQLEAECNSLKSLIGMKYVMLHADDCEEALSDLVTALLQKEKETLELKARVNELRGVVICEKCGNEISGNVMFCPSCGNPVPVKEEPPAARTNVKANVCAVCGAELEADAMFCTSCGAKVEQQNIEEPAGSRSIGAPVGSRIAEGAAPEEKKAANVCAVCGAELEADAIFCTVCGARVDQQSIEEPVGSLIAEESVSEEKKAVNVCSVCGAELEADAMFCIVCGARVEPQRLEEPVGSLSIGVPAVVPDDTWSDMADDDFEMLRKLGWNEPDDDSLPDLNVYDEEPLPGEKMDSNICAVCGAELDEDAMFCIACGARVDQQVEQRNLEAHVESQIIEDQVEQEIVEETVVVSDDTWSDMADDDDFEMLRELGWKEADDDASDMLKGSDWKEIDDENGPGLNISIEEPAPEEEKAADVCAVCGAELDEDAMFCTACGARVEQQSIEEPVESQIIEEPVEQQSIDDPLDNWNNTPENKVEMSDMDPGSAKNKWKKPTRFSQRSE